MEGLGGPISLDSYTTQGIDPSLEDCCRREVESNRRHNALTSTLKRHDVAALAERRRLRLPNNRNLVQLAQFNGCRCCYDPNSDGCEYPALTEYKEEVSQRHQQKQQDQEEDQECEIEKENEEDVEDHKEEKKTTNTTTAHSSNNDDDDNGDDEDDEFDYLLDEDLSGDDDNGSELKAMEERRRAELEYQWMVRQVTQQHGYGVHRQLYPLRVLKAAGLNRRGGGGATAPPPTAVLLHLVDPNSRASASLDYFLETVLAPEYPGTIFLRSHGSLTLQMDAALASKTLPSNVTNSERDLPALIVIQDGVAVHACPRLEGLVGGYGYGSRHGLSGADEDDGEVDAGAVRQWLDRCGVLQTQPPGMADLCFIRPEEQALMDSAFVFKMDQEEQEEGRYDCGVDGCHKLFKHEHVGIHTSEQSGLVVTEDKILSDDN